MSICPLSKKTAAIQNLGCSKNQIDGERVMALLSHHGYDITDDHAAADVVVVNTCAFIKEAQEEAIDTILEMAKLREDKGGRCKTLIVSGCFSERYRDKVKKDFPEVDVWAGVDDWSAVIKNFVDDDVGHNKIVDNKNFSADDGDHYNIYSQHDIKNHRHVKNNQRVLTEPIATQHIKIAEGCSHKCAFCVIPSIRGKFKSRSIDDIIGEARWLYDQGARELILVAQDTSFYGRDINTNLVRLLETILRETNFPWIRMMYLHPQFVSDELLSIISTENRLCKYFDIPLQHISDNILSAMNRKPLSADIYKLIDRVREKVCGATLRSSFILGFPSETEKEFGELARFVKHARFDKLGVFPFSPEEGTVAFALRPRPRASTVQKRCDELMSIQQNISREILENKIGQSTQIIIDRVSDDHNFNYEGRTRGDAPEVDGRVFIARGDCEIGGIYDAKIIGASDYDLFAEVVGPHKNVCDKR